MSFNVAVSSQFDSTSRSLLQRVRRSDPDAWERLSALYGPVVYGWCRRAGLQDQDAADAMQEVFRSVFRSIGSFQHNGRAGSFGGWLWSITRNQIRLFFRQREGIPQALGGSDARQWFAEHADGLDEIEPEAAVDRRRVLQGVLELVRGDFATTTWNAFARVTLEDESVQEVAAALGMTENAVRQAKFRVLRRLREELDGQL